MNKLTISDELASLLNLIQKHLRLHLANYFEELKVQVSHSFLKTYTEYNH